jgi:flagellar M-ring protein FliF
MDASRRLTLMAALAGVGVVMWLVVRWATTPTFVPLFQGLELSEIATIEQRLAKQGIPHRLDAVGAAVLVPVADVARARVALAQEGLPTSGRPGLELFDKPAWGMTDFTQRVTYQRALEGELARTIGRLRGVERAEVHLVLPAQTVLRRPERSASASVVLTMASGAALSPEAIQGITYIVSNSVEQLSADNVAVMDDSGRVLSAPAAAGAMAGLTTRQLDLRQSVERHLATKVEELLATVVGTGRARAQVSADLNFDQVDRTIEAFDPDGQVIQSEQRSDVGAGDSAGAQQSITSNTYQNSRRMEKIVAAVGNVTRLTVAVLVDEAALRQRGTGLRVDRLETMVRDAIGVDPNRGDRLTVMAVPFDTTAAVGAGQPGGMDLPPPPGRDLTDQLERLSRPALGLLAIGAVLFLALRVIRAPAPEGRAGAGAALPESGEAAAALPAVSVERAREAAALRGRLEAESTERPEAAVRVLRAWLSES